MKEQDFIHNIEKQTKDLPIPDSISPDKMKQMLDEANVGMNKSDINNKKPRHNLRRYSLVACAALVLIAGAVGISINQNDILSDDESLGHTTSPSDVEANDTSKDNESDLVAETNLLTPSSYEEYFDAMTTAYNDYYNSISSVTTNDLGGDIVNEESALEDGAANRYLDSSDKTSQSKEAMDTASATGEALSAEKGIADDDFSTTNTQEKTVDEGDIIKTDGTYIYKVISAFDNDTGYTTYRLTITKTKDGELTLVTSFNLDDIVKKSNSDDYIMFKEFYLHNNQLILMYNRENYSTESENTNTYIVIYDVSDKENPTKVKTLSQSGYYKSSRISDGYLLTVSDYTDTSLSDRTAYKNYIPCINHETIECEDIYYPKDILTDTTHVITTLDLSDTSDFTDTKAVPTAAGNIYVSDSNIYLYATIYDEVTKTEIMKVSYDKGILTIGNSAKIAGYLYGPFALNEYKGNLRIVATIPANNISLLRFDANDLATNISQRVEEDINTLYVLDDKMKLTGKIAGLAPGETIYSARFMGDVGYFVTYRNTDPLFSVDLSDPTNPKILGELKINGFSEYLHPYGDDILLGIGQETNPDTQEFLGLKLSMFDTSDTSNVTEEDKYIIENSEYTYATYNYKAIMINPDKNIFGFVYCAQVGNYYKYFYATYTYDKNEGFKETAKYELTDDSIYETELIRGLYIGDYFYLTTNDSITSYKLNDTKEIEHLSLK